MTLYGAGQDFDEVKRRFCDAGCLKANWLPLSAERDAAPRGNWVPVETPDGRQWSYRGELVFTFAGDAAPGETRGERFSAGIGLSGFHALRQKSLIPESF